MSGYTLLPQSEVTVVNNYEDFSSLSSIIIGGMLHFILLCFENFFYIFLRKIERTKQSKFYVIIFLYGALAFFISVLYGLDYEFLPVCFI